MINQQLFFRRMRDVALRRSGTLSSLSCCKSPEEWRKLKKNERKIQLAFMHLGVFIIHVLIFRVLVYMWLGKKAEKTFQ